MPLWSIPSSHCAATSPSADQRRSKCRYQSAIWFQIARMRLAESWSIKSRTGRTDEPGSEIVPNTQPAPKANHFSRLQNQPFRTIELAQRKFMIRRPGSLKSTQERHCSPTQAGQTRGRTHCGKVQSYRGRGHRISSIGHRFGTLALRSLETRRVREEKIRLRARGPNFQRRTCTIGPNGPNRKDVRSERHKQTETSPQRGGLTIRLRGVAVASGWNSGG